MPHNGQKVRRQGDRRDFSLIDAESGLGGLFAPRQEDIRRIKQKFGPEIDRLQIEPDFWPADLEERSTRRGAFPKASGKPDSAVLEAYAERFVEG